MCLDPYLGYTEGYLRVALDMRKIVVLFFGSSVCHFGVGYLTYFGLYFIVTYTTGMTQLKIIPFLS